MLHSIVSRRLLIAASVAAAFSGSAAWAQSKPGDANGAAAAAKRAAPAARPMRIYAITFRGMTEVEKGFEEYFASRPLSRHPRS